MNYLISIPVVICFLFSCGASPTEQTSSATQGKTPEVEIQKAPFVDLDVDEFKKMMDQPDVVLLDVRTPEETAEGKIEGAIEIDVKAPSFEEKIIALDKEKTYLVYCRSGKRSVTSCNKMADLGFSKLYNLVGGYIAWSEAQ